MKHTPGPWSRNIKPASKYTVVFAGRNTHVATVCTQGLTEAEIEGNRDLIAAAPELLEGLKAIWGMFDSGEIVRNIANDHSPDWALRMLTFTQKLKAAHAAIVKAEGNA